MATITGLTAERMLEIEAASVVDGEVLADHLILTKHDGTTIDAGSVVGPQGPVGPAGSALSVLSSASILEPGIANQRRAGRVLTVADFTTLLGLSTPVGLFNLGTIANLGSGGALVNKGAVTFGKGITGATPEAAIFSGAVGQALYIADTGAADPYRIPYGSFGCWFKTAKRGASQVLMSKEVPAQTAATSAFAFQLLTSNVLSFQFSDGAGYPSGTTVAGTTDVCDNKWHHAVVTYDGGLLCLYVDGMLEMASPCVSRINIGASGPFNIGGLGADSGNNAVGPHYGLIDEVFVTPDVLSEDQVRMLYAAKIAHGAAFTPTKVDLMVRRLRKGAEIVSGNFPAAPLHLYNFLAGVLTDAGSLNNTLTNNGAAVSCPGVNGLKGNAFNLNSALNQYLSATDTGLPAGTNSRSMGCWFKTLDTGTKAILAYGTGATAIQIRTVAGGALDVWDGLTQTLSSVPVCDGRWHFVVLVIDNAAVDQQKTKLYVDGKLMASAQVFSGTTLVGANGFLIGKRSDTAAYLNGIVDSAFITGNALTAEEISTLYALGSLSLGTSPKSEGDHVERLDATDIYLICDTLESQYQIDLAVAS